MELFTKQITVTFDEVDSKYTVRVSNSSNGDCYYSDCKTLPEVFSYISTIVKAKIVWVVK